jgi:hypothetical protein
MKHAILFSICFLHFLVSHCSIGHTITKFVTTTSGTTLGIERSLLVDEHNNIYQANFFRYSAFFGNTTVGPIVPPSIPSSFFEWSYFITKFDSTGVCSRAATLFSGDSVFNVTTCYYEGHFYTLVGYRHKIYSANDSLVSKGGYDIALLKFNSDFDLVGKLNIGGPKTEITTNKNLDVKNGKIFIGGSFSSDNINNIYIPYALNIGNDTLYCDQVDSNSKTEYFLSIIDTNLTPIKSKSAGGFGSNQCIQVKSEGASIYLVVQSTSNQKNNAMGIWFDYVTLFENRLYLVKLDENLEAKWMRKFGTTTTDFLSNLLLTSTPSHIMISGTTDRMGSVSGGGGGYGGGGSSNVPNKVFMDYGALLTASPVNTNDNFTFAFVYDTSGMFKWTSNLIPIQDAAYRKSTGKIIVAGSRNVNSSINGDTLINCGSSDSYIASVDPDSGVVKLIDFVCGEKNDIIHNLTVSNDEKIFASGITYSGQINFPTFVAYPNQGIANLFYISLDSIEYYPLNSNDISHSTELSIYPNPCHQTLNVRLPEHSTEKVSYTLYDITGRQIELSKIQEVNSTTSRIYLGDLQKGNYFLRVNAANDVFTKMFSVE